MKRFLFSVCALAAVVVGCSKSEVLNRPNAEVPIEFNPYAGRVPVTRSTSANIDTLGQYGFQVYAFLYNNDGPDWTSSPYMNKVVTCENPSADAPEWTYSGHAYWPASRKLAFIAYGLNTGNLISRPSNGEEYEFDFAVPDAVAEQKDLLVAAVQRDQAYIEEIPGTDEKPGTEEDGTVDFTFSHLLSRIGFSLVTKDSNNVPVTIEQVNLEGTFYKKGHVNLTDVASTTIKIDEEQKTAGRPFINPAEGDAEPKTYILLPNGSYTHKGSAAGTPIHDNSLLYIKNDLEGTDNDEYVDKFENDTTGKAAAEKTVAKKLLNRYMMIIPTVTPVISTDATATTKELTHNAKLKVKYFLPGAGTFNEVTVDLKDIDFEPGKSYDFKFKVSTAGISFSVEVEGWDTTGEDREVIKLN